MIGIILALSNERERNFMMDMFHKYYPVMKKISLGILQNKSQYEDVIQDCFESLIDKIDVIIKLEDFILESYIITCVKYKCFDYNKKYKRERNHLTDEEFDTAALSIRNNDTIELEVLKKIEYNRLGQLLAQIPEKQKDVMLMKYLYDLDDGEIAAELKIDKNSVRMYLTRGRRSLQSLLQKEAAHYG